MSEHFVTLKEAAAATKLSQQVFREKVRAGMFPDRVKGKGYDLVAVCHARVDDLRQRQAETPTTLQLTTERARKERAQAEKTEFDLAIAKQEYVHISHLERILERFASSAAAKFDSIASRLKQHYPDMSNSHVEAIRKEIALARNTVAMLRPD